MAGCPSAPNHLKLAVDILLTSYKYPHIPLDVVCEESEV
jgi:hypothetical protein